MLPRTLRPLLWCLLSLLPGLAQDGDGATPLPAAPESRTVKAAYVYNFTKFIDWAAEEGISDRAATVVICVLGSDPVGSALDEIAALESKGRPILVHHVRPGESIPACHILYIGISETPRLASVLAQVGAAGTLTVSDIPRFAEQGGMIGFTLDRGRVRVVINAQRVRGAGLRISSKLLEVAKVVTEAES